MTDFAPDPKSTPSPDPATSTPPPTADSASAASTAKGPEVHSTEVGSVFVSNYPPFSFWKDETLDTYREVLADPTSRERDGRESPLGLYMHIPFCRKRCKFCYFRVYIDKNADDIQRYLDALATEVERYAEQPAIADRPLRFVYFGGGTPSYPAVKHMTSLFERARAALPWDEVDEVTLECEPGTLSESKVAAYRELGITRLSLGVENWNEEILRENGRAHEVKEIDRCLPWIKAQGFDQLNVDLIAGMVGETWDSWKETVERTIDIDPDSVTVYQMELPFNTTYSQTILAGGDSPVADWDTKRAWNDYAFERFLEAGYEISSAYTVVKAHRDKPGQGRFAYRDSLWHGADMLGTGVASFGHLGGVHAQNVSSWNEYLEKVEGGELPLGRAFRTSADERFTRELILQMKLGRLDFAYFRDKFGIDPLARYGDTFEQLEDRGMVDRIEPTGLELSRAGLLQVDSLLPAFYDARYQNARYT